MSQQFLDRLDYARDVAGVPFLIDSGWRCKKHNKEVGGVDDSEHTTGEGADIRATGSHTRFRIIYGAILAGFTRIGIGKTFVHLGGSFLHPQEVAWHYYTEDKK